MKNILVDEKEVRPSKIVCIGRNYSEHIAELNNEVPAEMVFFIKPNSSISKELVFPKKHDTCHYEAEICFLIKANKLAAVGFGLDLTLREVQSKLKEKGLPWERAKAFDNSAVFSNFISIKDENISNLSIELYSNGVLKQKGNVSLMINKPNDILKEAKSFLSFEDGDIIMSGTPKGVGTFYKGDELLGKIILNNKLIIEKIFKCK